MKSWLKLWRKLIEEPIWLEEPFTKGQAWVDLLLLAQSSDNKNYKAGCIYRSLNDLSTRWKWSRGRVTRFLDYLTRESMIHTETKVGLGTIICITNWNNYQLGTDMPTTQLNRTRTTNGTTDGTTYEHKNGQLNGQPNDTTKRATKRTTEKSKKTGYLVEDLDTGELVIVQPNGQPNGQLNDTTEWTTKKTTDDTTCEQKTGHNLRSITRSINTTHNTKEEEEENARACVGASHSFPSQIVPEEFREMFGNDYDAYKAWREQ